MAINCNFNPNKIKMKCLHILFVYSIKMKEYLFNVIFNDF